MDGSPAPDDREIDHMLDMAARGISRPDGGSAALDVAEAVVARRVAGMILSGNLRPARNLGDHEFAFVASWNRLAGCASQGTPPFPSDLRTVARVLAPHLVLTPLLRLEHEADQRRRPLDGRDRNRLREILEAGDVSPSSPSADLFDCARTGATVRMRMDGWRLVIGIHRRGGPTLEAAGSRDGTHLPPVMTRRRPCPSRSHGGH